MMDEKRKREIEALAGETFGIEPRLSWEALTADGKATAYTGDSQADVQRVIDEYAAKYESWKKYHAGAWKHYPHFMESLDAAMQLTREGWVWTERDMYGYVYVDVCAVPPLVEPFDRKMLAFVTIQHTDGLSRLEAWATAMTLCALKAAGVDVERILRGENESENNHRMA